MTAADARRLILLHSGWNEELDHPKWERGFLGSLRPYQGHLAEENFHEVMAALRAIQHELQQPLVARELVGALWSMCHLARAWAIVPEGMLRRNGLIAEADVARVERWIDCVAYTVMMLLSGADEKEAFAEYDEMRNA